ncbi:MAG: diguanylate cyclase [Actinomycetota bacterium]|nr:diguanylate cyclase [Actinomycetota bacterium]
MSNLLTRFNLFAKLRLWVGLVVLAGVSALALFLSAQFSGHLGRAYREAGRNQLEGLARAWGQGLRSADLRRPRRLQRRINTFRRHDETLHKISISWHGKRRRTLLVQSGHVHDPDGAKRDVTTSRVARSRGGKRAPIDAREWGYREVRAADGAHYGELNYPLRRHGRRIAAMELHYDLKNLDQGLARDKRNVALAAGGAAILLSLLLNALLGRTLLVPLRRMREATRRIGQGETGTRLDWKRRDEIGQLASDFDGMAAELQAVQSHLEELALRDPLTGLLNHRAFQERMSEELRRAERERCPVSIVALDVDHFKEINDRSGHAAGDQALRSLANAIRSELRPSDVCGRVGGDEFMLVLYGASADAAAGVVERLRGKVSELEVGPAGESVTISAGIAEFPRHSLAQEELMHLADGAMYWSKTNGRNRSFVYSAEHDFALSAQDAADRSTRDGLVNTMHALAKAVDAKDGYTSSHSHRVARYAVMIAERLGVDPDRMEAIRTAAVLHDVGKIGISDALLLKPGPLTEEEWETMKRHSEFGRDILTGAGMDEIAGFVLHLHERYDGRGYPQELSGEDIPLESRILHVADAFEAMTSARVYRQGLPLAAAVEEVERHAGGQFDPQVAEIMLDLVRSGDVSVESAEVPAEAERILEAVLDLSAENGRGAGAPRPRDSER